MTLRPFRPHADCDVLELVDALGVALRKLSKMESRPRNQSGRHDAVDPLHDERTLLKIRVGKIRSALESAASRRAANEERAAAAAAAEAAARGGQ